MRFLLKALVVTAAVAAAAALPVRAYWGEPGLMALAFAAGVALAGAAVGRLPRRLIPSTTPDAPVHAAMAGIGARLLATSALAFVVTLSGAVPSLPFAASLVVLYMALLTLEVRDAVLEISGGPR
jgi:hypothetical protein